MRARDGVEATLVSSGKCRGAILAILSGPLENEKSEAGFPCLAHEIPASDLVAVTGTAIFATATTTATALFARFGDVYRQRPAVDAFAIKRVDCRLRLFRRAHGDEPKATWTSAVAIRRQTGLQHCAMGGEHVLKSVFGCVEGKISNEQFIITHVY